MIVAVKTYIFPKHNLFNVGKQLNQGMYVMQCKR